MKRRSSLAFVALLLLSPGPPPRAAEGPLTPTGLAEALRASEERPRVEVSTLATTPRGRGILVVRLRAAREPARVRVLLIGQQHGNEHAGKDAIARLVMDVSSGVRALPEDVEVWAVPMANPDGAAMNARRNAAGADLNRDHLLLAQPETRALHALARRVKPHLVVDAHEFTRDSGDYAERGWDEWPLIMMDGVNDPLVPQSLVATAERWINEMRPLMDSRGFEYTRYYVGGLPPHEEQRHSTLEGDDARNGLAASGALSFIIESGVRRSAPDPQADLGRRVDAYLALLDELIRRAGDPAEALDALVESARDEALPAWIPVNAFWGAGAGEGGQIRVRDKLGQELLVNAPNFMSRRVVKRRVPAPLAYALPAPVPAPLASLVERVALPSRSLESPLRVVVEKCRLLRVENEYDPVYARYAGRQIVSCEAGEPVELARGSLVIDLGGPMDRRVVRTLEPQMLYGLFQHEEFRALVGEKGEIPVLRVTGAALSGH